MNPRGQNVSSCVLIVDQSVSRCRLCDVVHSEKKLTLVFEYSDQDLKKYFDSCNGEMDPDIVKVFANLADIALCTLRTCLDSLKARCSEGVKSQNIQQLM